MASRDPGQLFELMLDAARSTGAIVADAPTQLTGSKFNSDVLSEVISGRSIERGVSDLPATILAVELDGIPVLFGELSGPALQANVEAQLRRYKNQATIARSWLGSNAPNLQLFLIGPMHAIGDRVWRQIAAGIEADDRTCRKLVWLFDADPDITDAVHFLERTFIARPWPKQQRSEQLDSMADFELPPGWEEVIETPELQYDELVNRLIALEGANS